MTGFRTESLRRGTMLMEAVMTLPILITVFLACFQFIMIAYAKLMTEHAAHVALRVAEVQCPADRRVVARSAARRILAPVSWSGNTVDLAQYKAKIPSSFAQIKSLAQSAPDQLNLNFVDVPEDARQPLGWFPIWNSSWLESQVEVDLTETTTPVPRLECVVSFKCPLLVPIIAEALVTAGAAETFTPKIFLGKKDGPKDTPCVTLKAKAFRILTYATVGAVMPPVEKGGITGL